MKCISYQSQLNIIQAKTIFFVQGIENFIVCIRTLIKLFELTNLNWNAANYLGKMNECTLFMITKKLLVFFIRFVKIKCKFLLNVYYRCMLYYGK